ncbi:MAG TPA: SRPBCC family protein [Flavitalea sp.]|nr:SRPBCC family protein [Flavitalea sp.]
MKHDISGQASISIHAQPDKVWSAITEPEEIKKYFFGTDTITDWKVGHPITFEGEWEGKKYKDKGTILAFEPGKMLRYSYWSSMSGIEDKPENYVPITYEIDLDNSGTKVTITQENIPSQEMKEHSLENWKKVLQGLKKVVEEENTTITGN